MAKDTLGLVFFPAFDWMISPGHPERQERLLYTRDQLEEEGLFDCEEIREYRPRLAQINDLQRAHVGVPAEAVEPQTERFCQPQQGTHPRGAAAGTYCELPQGQPSQDHPCTHARESSAYTLHGESEREGDAEQPSLSASRRRRFLRDVPDDA